MTKLLKLSKGMFTLVDDDVYEKYKSLSWHAHNRQGKYYANHSAFSNVNGVKKVKSVSLHRLITNAPKGVEVDHINGDPLDNRRANLRFCNRSENTRNSIKRSDNTSGYKGVAFSKRINKWRAYIYFEKKQKHLGYFDSVKDAARAYSEAANKYFKEFAYVTNN